MCLPWNHKWETLDTKTSRQYEPYDRPGSDLPIYVFKIITQRCSLDLGGCGKEIVRKYRV